MATDQVTQEVQQELDEVTASLKQARKEVAELVSRRDSLKEALICKHKWEDGGSGILIVDHCKKCKYTRYI